MLISHQLSFQIDFFHKTHVLVAMLEFKHVFVMARLWTRNGGHHVGYCGCHVGHFGRHLKQGLKAYPFMSGAFILSSYDSNSVIFPPSYDVSKVEIFVACLNREYHHPRFSHIYLTCGENIVIMSCSRHRRIGMSMKVYNEEILGNILSRAKRAISHVSSKKIKYP